jgi:intracellular multiplication protein IcmJ
MKLLPLQLVSKRGNWQRFQKRRSLANFQEIERKVFERDDHTCQYCGFKCDKYQVVVNKNHNYGGEHNAASNMATACKFCAQCILLDGIGSDGNSGGYIIYLPEISQNDLNNFCKVLFSSMLNDSPYKGKLQTTYLSLQDREQIVCDIFGPNSSDPYVLGQGIIDSNIGGKQLNHALLKQLRLLPDRRCFQKEINYWKETVYSQIPL